MKNASLPRVFAEYIRYYQDPTNRIERKDPVTIKSYINKYLILLKFLRYRDTPDILACEFTPQVAKLYYNHLARKYKHNYAARIVDLCSTVMDWGTVEGMISHNPLGSFSIPKENPKTPKYFTPKQIEAWENYVSLSSIKQKAADAFTLIMHTGLDYGDLDEIRRYQVVEKQVITDQKPVVFRYLVKVRHKNRNNKKKSESIIPLSPAAERILEKYDFQMRLMSNPKMNEYIKRVAEDLGMDQTITLKDGRKIFGMNKLNNEGYSMEATSKMLGHKICATTQKTYAWVNMALVHREVSMKMAG